MPTDNASVIELVHAIGKISHELMREDGSSSSLCNTSREELIRNAERLAIAAREPEENLYFQATQVRLSSLRVFLFEREREASMSCMSSPLSVVCPDSPECRHQDCHQHGRFRSDTFFLWLRH